MPIKNKPKFSKLRKEFKQEWKFFSFKLLLISTFLLIIGLIFFSKMPLIFTPILTFWIGAFAYHEILNKRQRDKKNVFQKLYTFYLILLNLIFLGLYIAFIFKITIFSIFFLVSSIALIFFISAIYALILLIGSKENLVLLVLTYVFLISITIILFGYCFAFISAFEGEALVPKIIGETNLTAWDYIYFSSNTFYSMSFGDFVPQGWKMKFLGQIELILSAIIHVIILGNIISSRFAKD